MKVLFEDFYRKKDIVYRLVDEAFYPVCDYFQLTEVHRQNEASNYGMCIIFRNIQEFALVLNLHLKDIYTESNLIERLTNAGFYINPCQIMHFKRFTAECYRRGRDRPVEIFVVHPCEKTYNDINIVI